jgi:hypothetical protein
MDLITREDLKTLLAEPRTPCVSIFMPTHRGGGEEDLIRWRVHMGEVESQLVTTGLRASEATELLESARKLLEDVSFWKHQCEGLAFFLAPEFQRLYRLPMVFEDLVTVGERFHIKPLLPLISSNGRFYVLALSQHGVRLLQGTRDRVSEVDLKGVPRSLAEALLTHEAKEPFSFHGRRAGEGAGSWGGIFHGHGVGIDDSKDELLHYFQKIDRGLHPLLTEERAPLVLAAVDYLQPIYRQANTYAHLLEEGVAGNPDRLSSKELHDRAWDLVQPSFELAQKKAAAQYHQRAGTGNTAREVKEIVPAAYQGRVETLFVASNRQRWGRFDSATWRVEEHEQPRPGDEDLLNLAAVSTLAHGRTVYAVEPEHVPDGGLIAAVFHLPLPKHGKRP